MIATPTPLTPAAGALVIDAVDPRSEPSWDAQLVAFPEATVFHSTGWCSALLDTYGFTPLYLRALRDGAFAGCLPLMEVRSPLTGLRGVSLPFTDDCDALATDEAVREALIAKARELARERGWKYLELRLRRPPTSPTTPTPPTSPTSPTPPLFFSHRTDLSIGPEAVMKRVHDSARRSMKKAVKEGVSAEVHTEVAAMREYYRLHCLARKGHGLPPQTLGFFLKLHAHLIARGKGAVVLTRRNGQAVAGAVYFTFGRQVTYKFGASDFRFLPFRPNHLVMGTALNHFSGQGFASFDFGRTSLWNEGLRFYKTRWGSKEEHLFYMRFDPTSGECLPPPDGAGGAKTRLFQKLPIFASRLVGALLYKHMA